MVMLHRTIGHVLQSHSYLLQPATQELLMDMLYRNKGHALGSPASLLPATQELLVMAMLHRTTGTLLEALLLFCRLLITCSSG